MGRGTILVNLGTYVDVHGNNHPLDVEMPVVYYVFECPYNILSIVGLRHEQMYLDTSRSVLDVPGVRDTSTSHEEASKYPELDEDCNRVCALKTGIEMKPVLEAHPINRGVVWFNQSSQTYLVEDPKQWCHVAVVAIDLELPNDGVAEVPHDAYLLEPAFLAHLPFHQSNWVLKRMKVNDPSYW